MIQLIPNHVYKFPMEHSALFLHLGTSTNGDEVFIRYAPDRIESISIARFDPLEPADADILELCDLIDITNGLKMPEWYQLFVGAIATDFAKHFGERK